MHGLFASSAHGAPLLWFADLTALTLGVVTPPSGISISRSSTSAYPTSDITFSVGAGTDTAVVSSHNANTTKRGLLIFEQRQNSLPQSSLINDVTAWNNPASGSATYTSGLSAPDGTTNAMELSVTSGSFGRYRSGTVTTNGSYTWSFYVRSPSGTGTYQGFYTSNGGNTFPNSTTLTTTWQRVDVTRTIVGTGYVIGPQDGRAQALSAGARDSVFYQEQLEFGNFPGPPIPTTTTPITRSQDIVTVTAPLISSGRVSMEIKFQPYGGRAEHGNPMRWRLANGDLIEIIPGTGVVNMTVGGILQSTTAGITWARTDVDVQLYIAMGAGWADVTYAINGGPNIALGVSGTVHPAMTASASIALNDGGAYQLCHELSYIAFHKSSHHPTFANAASVVFTGNSLTLDAGTTTPGTDAYPVKTMANLGLDTRRDYRNYGVNGQTTQQMTSTDVAKISPSYRPGQQLIIIAWEMGNDYTANGGGVGAAYASTALANWATYIAAIRAAFPRAIIGVPTITPRGNTDFRNFANAVNPTLLAMTKGSIYGDGAIDFAGDSRLSNAFDVTYYLPDNIHHTTAGAAVKASLAQAWLTSLSLTL